MQAFFFVIILNPVVLMKLFIFKRCHPHLLFEPRNEIAGRGKSGLERDFGYALVRVFQHKKCLRKPIFSNIIR